MKKIFLICPVRNATEEQKTRMDEYIKSVEDNGDRIFYPARDNSHELTDPIGYNICIVNCDAIRAADEVHIFWDPNSSGSLFDLGSAFALNKKLVIVNAEDIKTENGKSFTNMIKHWSSFDTL